MGTPAPCEQTHTHTHTHTAENITLLQLRWRAVKIGHVPMLYVLYFRLFCHES